MISSKHTNSSLLHQHGSANTHLTLNNFGCDFWGWIIRISAACSRTSTTSIRTAPACGLSQCLHHSTAKPSTTHTDRSIFLNTMTMGQGIRCKNGHRWRTHTGKGCEWITSTSAHGVGKHRVHEMLCLIIPASPAIWRGIIYTCCPSKPHVRHTTNNEQHDHWYLERLHCLPRVHIGI